MYRYSAVWSVLDKGTDVAAAAVEGGLQLPKDGWDLVSTGAGGGGRAGKEAAAEWASRAAVVVRRFCCDRDIAWNVAVPSALSMQLGMPRRRGGGGGGKATQAADVVGGGGG